MVKNPLLISGICLIISLVFGWALIYPQYQEFSILRKKVEGKEIELESETVYFADLQKISQELQKYQTPLSKIDSALPKTSSLLEILNFIQRTVPQSGLILKGLSPVAVASGVEETQIKETRINLGLSGDYSSFKNFLFVLEQSARLFEVESISFSSGKEGFGFDLTIKTYSY